MKLGIEVSSKVTETEYDSLLERYTSITLSNSSFRSRNTSLFGSLGSIREEASQAVQTANRVETAVKDMSSVVENQNYYNVLATGVFGLHYFSGVDNQGRAVRYACNHSNLAESTLAYRNGADGFFYSTDGGRAWSFGWNSDQTAAMNGIQLPQTLLILDGRYETAKRLSEALLLELDTRFETAKKLSEALWKALDEKYAGAAGELSPELLTSLDSRYETAKKLSEALWQTLNEKYGGAASALTDALWKILDQKYGGLPEDLSEPLWQSLDEKYGGAADELTDGLMETLDSRYATAKKLSNDLLRSLDERHKTASALADTLLQELDERFAKPSQLADTLWEELDRRYGSHEPEPTEPDPTEPEEPDDPDEQEPIVPDEEPGEDTHPEEMPEEGSDS